MTRSAYTGLIQDAQGKKATDQSIDSRECSSAGRAPALQFAIEMRCAEVVFPQVAGARSGRSYVLLLTGYGPGGIGLAAPRHMSRLSTGNVHRQDRGGDNYEEADGPAESDLECSRGQVAKDDQADHESRPGGTYACPVQPVPGAECP